MQILVDQRIYDFNETSPNDYQNTAGQILLDPIIVDDHLDMQKDQEEIQQQREETLKKFKNSMKLDPEESEKLMAELREKLEDIDRVILEERKR